MLFHALMLLLAIHKNRKRTTFVKENILKKCQSCATACDTAVKCFQ